MTDITFKSRLIACLKIIRPINLGIIILTQALFRFFIVETYYGIASIRSGLTCLDISLLILATILIASGGYVINDLFDRQTDAVNKPGKIIPGEVFSKKALKVYYAILTITGIAAGIFLSLKVQFFSLGLIFPAIALMLWLYSSHYKNTVLLGNLMVAFMSGMVILIVWLFEFFALRAQPLNYAEAAGTLVLIGLIAGGYTLFAFMVTMIREILKDAEDIEGDAATRLRTLPVVYGINFSMKTATSLTVATIMFLGLAQFFLYQWGVTFVFWYLMIAVQPLLLFLIYYTLQAKNKEDFHFVSNISKIIMIAGILSMQLFYISF